MRQSAKSTDESSARFLKPSARLLLLGIFVSTLWVLTAGAQQGGSASTVLLPIAKSETIRNIRDDESDDADTIEPIPTATDTVANGVNDTRVNTSTFRATAYCLKGQTAAGVSVRRGIIAADPKVLPLGSVVRIHAGDYSGIYTVMDTGGAIRGQRIDIYIPTRAEAVRFGSRKVKVEVIRRGWEPDQGEPTTM
ncbi:MAG TPA: 3D domain-containing protein [Blastocatellia bacterium]|nr:3D domain-containing protein [Blastocatellia bacterium]